MNRLPGVAVGLLAAEVVALAALKGYRWYRWLVYTEPFKLAPHEQQ